MLLAYWTAYAVVVPVTIWDSQAYNLARLLIANQGGLFGNPGWNADRQVAFPWGFDAIHFPFLSLGWGCALPSFACFIGLMVIVFRMVSGRFDARTAWYCCLAMLALPTVVFQATSTKNDLGVVFGIGCWVYALYRFQQEKLFRFLFFGAAGLGFAAGAKSTGVPFFILLSAYTVWRLRSDKRMVMRFLGVSLLSVVLLGSIETYWNNQRTFGNPIGTPHIVSHANHDGFAGTLANFIRYVIGSTDLGQDLVSPHSPFTARLETICRTILQTLHLENKGYRPDFNDSNLEFVKNGWESGSAFGPLGTISLWLAVWILFTHPVRDVLWRLCLAGFGSLILLCATVAWMPWNMRFLMLPFLLFTLAGTIFLTGPGAWGILRRGGFLLVAVGAAVLFPLYSFNKTPRDLWCSVTDRRSMTLKERPAMSEIIDDLDARRKQIGRTPVLLSAGGNSWVLPVLQLRGLRILPSPQIDPSRIRQLAARDRCGFVYILALNRSLPEQRNLIPIKKYGETDSGLFLWLATDPAVIPAIGKNSLAFTLFSGWHQVEHNGDDWLCWTAGRGRVAVTASADETVTLSGEIYSARPTNHIDVVANGTNVDSLEIRAGKWAAHSLSPVRVTLKKGDNLIDFVSQDPPAVLPPDQRPLAVAVKNLRIEVAPLQR